MQAPESMAATFDAEEERDGVRFGWNVWPASRLEATRLVIPIGCMYTPMKKNVPLVYYDPVICKGNCRSVLNPFSSVDVRSKMWSCPFCLHRNQLPPAYTDISETNLPAELIPRYTTIEYALNRNVPGTPPAFLFVLDTCLQDEDLKTLKDIIVMALSLVPEDALVGLITFGKTVQLWELAFEECPKAFVFNGTKEVSQKQIQDVLVMSNKSTQMQRNPTTGQPIAPTKNNRFLIPQSEVFLTLTNVLEELQRDPNRVKNDKRPLRATGVALNVAVALLEQIIPNSAARIMMFTGGPCTTGPGMIVSEELKEPLRAWGDIVKDNAKHMRKAMKFYEAIGKRAVGSGHAIDVFPCSYDQCGFYEMQDLAKKTGGLVIQADDFDTPMFKDSFKKIFTRDEQGNFPLTFNSTIEVLTSRELKVCGAIGHCASLNKKGPSVAETEIGIGNTTAWRTGSLDGQSTFAFFFEVVNQHNNPLPPHQKGLIQFQTSYQTASGQKVLRITTLGRSWASDPGTLQAAVSAGFDQETAACLMARLAVNKAETEESFDVLRWLDRMLIRLNSKFADYRKDDPSSFSLTPNFSLYPQFMFHLRRSHFFQVFNNSPDETAFYRYMLNRETVASSLIMIQPTLEAYSFTGPPIPVLLASTSVAADRILLLDTFFTVTVHYGETIGAWRNAKYHEDPKHENFRLLLDAPKTDAKTLMEKRFPTPRYVECDQGTSQARFLLAILDPVITHNTIGTSQNGILIFTDDANLKVFMESLKKLVVTSS